jgi:hypothetical protein
VGDELAGYVILTLGFSVEYRGREAFVDELYVEEKFRRQGLAGARWSLSKSARGSWA